MRAMSAEGTQDIQSLLTKFGIKAQFAEQYANKLEEEGIESTEDLKYFETIEDFSQLLKKCVKRLGDQQKFITAWKSIHPVNVFVIYLYVMYILCANLLDRNLDQRMNQYQSQWIVKNVQH